MYKYLQKIQCRKTFFLNWFFVGINDENRRIRSGSGSISQRHGSADPDPDPHQNVMYPEHCFSWRYFYIIFPREKVKKKLQNSINQGFPYYFCLMIEGSGYGTGSIPLTNGSGSRRPKNTWIRIRIRNTAFQQFHEFITSVPDPHWLQSGSDSSIFPQCGYASAQILILISLCCHLQNF